MSGSKTGLMAGEGGVRGTIKDSAGNVFEVVPAISAFGPRATVPGPIDIQKFKAPGKPSGSDPVYPDSEVSWFDFTEEFSILFKEAPDTQEPAKVYYRAVKDLASRRWEVKVLVRGHAIGKVINYAIYSPTSNEEIDPSIIIVDPVVVNAYVLRLVTTE